MCDILDILSVNGYPCEFQSNYRFFKLNLLKKLKDYIRNSKIKSSSKLRLILIKVKFSSIKKGNC